MSFIYEDCVAVLRDFLSNVAGTSKRTRSPGRKMAKTVKKARVDDAKTEKEMEATLSKCMESTARSAEFLSRKMVHNFSRTVLLKEHSRSKFLSDAEYVTIIE